MRRAGGRAAPTRPKRGRAAAAMAAAAVLAALGSLEVSRVPELLLRGEGGGVVAALRLPDGSFSHVFVHSFHLTPVEERFKIEPEGMLGARLRLRELRYQSCGVGMPADAEGGYRLEDGVFVLSMDRVFDSVPILVSVLPGHGIVAEGVYWPFRNWAAPEGGLRLSARMAISIRLRRCFR